jgi:hypothetical protein
MNRLTIRRSISSFLALLFLVSAVGCEQLSAQFPSLGRTPEAEKTAEIHTPSPLVTQTPSAALTPSTQAQAQIVLWLPPVFDPENGTPQGMLLNQQLQTFASDHPEVTLEVRVKAVEGSGGLLDTLTTASLAAPTALPGLLLLPRSEYEKAARAGLLLSIESPEKLQDPAQVFPFADAMTLVKGNRFGYPFAGDFLCMAYKPLQVAYPPTTWQEVILGESKVLAFPADDPQGIMPLLLYMNHKGTLSNDNQKISLSEEAIQKSLLVISEGANTNVFPYWLTDFSGFDQSWKALKDSSATYGMIWASQYLTETPENITLTKLPAVTEEPFTLADGWVLAFPQTSNEKFLLYQELAQYLLDPDFQSQWSEAAGLIPVSSMALSGWKNKEVSSILVEIGNSAQPLPSNDILFRIGPLFRDAANEMIRKQTSYIESTNKILNAINE